MKAAVFRGPRNLSIENYPLGKLEPRYIRVQIEACGICGTDFHIYTGESYSKPPVIPGHEFTGIVVDKGEGAYNFNIDDHVAVDPNIYCGECQYCRDSFLQYQSSFRLF